MKLDSRKKSRRDRMMRSKSFDMQEVIEIGRKEGGESRSFPILLMGIILIEDALQMEGRECEVQERLMIRRRKSCQNEESALAWNKKLFLDQWQWTKRS